MAAHKREGEDVSETPMIELPPLPEPDTSSLAAMDDPDEILSFSKDAMRAYATACVLAEREAICKMIDDMDGHTGGHGGGQRPRAGEIIDAIRARSKP
jgi:hypothetical protein